MNKINIKTIIKYLLIFIYFFICIQFIFIKMSGDQMYNFGFSYGIVRGEIPYKDFNMIITPFSAFFYAVPFKIFGIDLVIFNLFQAFLLTVMFYYFYKILNNKASILIPIISFMTLLPFMTILYEGYNFLLLFELILLIYFEKEKKNDYLIGLLLGICFLTKQTVGIFLCLPSIYYLFKDRKKILKRIVAFIVPIFIFLVYLLSTNSFIPFIDQCFLGMFDFTSKNGRLFDIYFIIFLICILIVSWFIKKDKSKITNYYVLAFASIAVPLFDYYHVTLFAFSVLFLILNNIEIKYNLSFKNCYLYAILLSTSWIVLQSITSEPTTITNFNHFRFYTVQKLDENNYRIVDEYISNNKDKKIAILSCMAYFYKIQNDLNIDYYDLINYGNNGYNGTKKIIDMLKNEEDIYIFIDLYEYSYDKNDRQQINKEVMKYVIDNYKEYDRVGQFTIYHK